MTLRMLILLATIAASSTAHAGFVAISDMVNLEHFAIGASTTRTFERRFDAPDADTQVLSDLISTGFAAVCYRQALNQLRATCEAEGFNGMVYGVRVNYNSPAYQYGQATAMCKLDFTCVKLLDRSHLPSAKPAKKK